MESNTRSQPGARSALLEAARAELVEHGRSAISLRAVARRAGVSHAAPKYHFGDRAGLLTAIATEGFSMLTMALRSVHPPTEADVGQPLGALGRAYIDFSLAHPALFDLMFRPGELHPTDPELLRAQREAIGVLSSVTDGAEISLMSWALAHGLAVLARDGALQAGIEAPSPSATIDLAHQITGSFAALVASR
jgi:AcrR family transcriptional regulator